MQKRPTQLRTFNRDLIERVFLNKNRQPVSNVIRLGRLMEEFQGTDFRPQTPLPSTEN